MSRWALLVAIPLALFGCSSRPSEATTPCELAPDLDATSCAALKATALPNVLPPARGNKFGDDERAALMGHRIFFDARFSSNLEVRCATCHAPETAFHDGLAVSKGLEVGDRNAPSVLSAARARWLLWDGRADSVWSQPVLAFENPKEMNFPRREIAKTIRTYYAEAYQPIFGELPDLADEASIDRTAANVGKSIEAYLRRLATKRAPWDRYLAGESALDASQKRGMVVFARAGCLGCHSGPSFTDDRFRNLGVPALAGAALDRGRAAGLEVRAASVFNDHGAFFDGPRPEGPIETPTASDIGAFHTPSLREVTKSAPYGHNGRFATLREMVVFHLHGGGRGKGGFLGEVDPMLTPRTLSDAEIDDLLAFLNTLSGELPTRPWNDWPDR